jgi:hypothetical protein
LAVLGEDIAEDGGGTGIFSSSSSEDHQAYEEKAIFGVGQAVRILKNERLPLTSIGRIEKQR